MFDLSGRVALVTGAGQNTGVGIARCLAERGAAVAINDLFPERAERVAKELAETGCPVAACPFDVTSEAEVAEGVAHAQGELGPIDILVNNAGVPPEMAVARFQDMPADAWARFVDLNLYGVLHCTKVLIDGMCERGFGRIITISSGAGQVGIPMGVSIYGAGKGGAIAFMRHLALEVAGSGVTANSLALGLMGHVDDASLIETMAKTVPVGRLGRGEDVGAAVVYLASNEASWMTGQTIGLNGGSITT